MRKRKEIEESLSSHSLPELLVPSGEQTKIIIELLIDIRELLVGLDKDKK